MLVLIYKITHGCDDRKKQRIRMRMMKVLRWEGRKNSNHFPLNNNNNNTDGWLEGESLTLEFLHYNKRWRGECEKIWKFSLILSFLGPSTYISCPLFFFLGYLSSSSLFLTYSSSTFLFLFHSSSSFLFFFILFFFFFCSFSFFFNF